MAGKFTCRYGPRHSWMQGLRQHLQMSLFGSLLAAPLSSMLASFLGSIPSNDQRAGRESFLSRIAPAKVLRLGRGPIPDYISVVKRIW